MIGEMPSRVSVSTMWPHGAAASVPQVATVWRSRLVCAALVLLLHSGLIYLLLQDQPRPEASFKPEVIAVRWQAAPVPQAKSAVEPPPAPQKPAEPVTKPKPERQHKPLPKPVAVKRPVPQPSPRHEKVTPKQAVMPAEPVAAAAAPSAQAAKPSAAALPVVAPRYQAPGLNNPPLRYPPVSRRLGEEGKVRLKVLVSPEGRALQIQMLTSSGSSRLDAAARELVGRWRFLPATKGGAMVQGWVEIPIVFQLRSQ